MIDRRRAVRLAVAAVAVLAAALLLRPSRALAQAALQPFFPFLIDLPGWDGQKPDGFAVELPGSTMITATRAYRRDGASLNAQIVSGPAAQGALMATQANVNVATGDAHMLTATIDGLPVARSFAVHDKSGIILVALSKTAMFSMSFRGLSEDEALALARKFDWKAILGAMAK